MSDSKTVADDDGHYNLIEFLNDLLGEEDLSPRLRAAARLLMKEYRTRHTVEAMVRRKHPPPAYLEDPPKPEWSYIEPRSEKT